MSSLVCSFNRGNIKGTNSSKICVWCLCMSVLFCVRVGIGFVDWLEKGWEEFWSVHLLMTDFDFPEVDRTLKSNYKLTWCDCFFFINGWFSQHSVSVKCSLFMRHMFHLFNSADEVMFVTTLMHWPPCLCYCSPKLWCKTARCRKVMKYFDTVKFT